MVKKLLLLGFLVSCGAESNSPKEVTPKQPDDKRRLATTNTKTTREERLISFCAFLCFLWLDHGEKEDKTI